MIFIKLFLNALGSNLMVWGMVVVGLLLTSCVDYLVDRTTGHYEWMTRRVERWKLILIPCVLVQIWYAAYAVQQVRLDAWSWEDSLAYSVLVHGMAILGMLIVAVVFDLMFRAWLQIYESPYLSGLIAGAGLAAYGIFHTFPYPAELLGEAWPRVLHVLSLFLG